MLISAQNDLEVVGVAEDAAATMRVLEETKPHLVTLDLSLPGTSGVELIKQVRMHSPDLKILVISMHKETLYAERCIRAGANGYLMKAEPGKTVVRAIRRILDGEMVVSGAMTSSLLRRMTGSAPEDQSSVLAALSDRELEVFEMLGAGIGTREIAEQLHLSVKTIQYYRENIKNKLDLKDATELMHAAFTWTHGEGE